MLQEACNLELVRLPSPTPNNPWGDQTKHCSYHQNSGHSIEECFKVKDLLKELFRSGALDCFISWSENNRGRGRGRSGRERGGKAGSYYQAGRTGTLE